MSRKGPIIIAEDDVDDRDVLREVFKSLSITNELKFFDNGQQVLDYLLTTRDSPFIIISDVNLPLMSGTRLRQAINDNEKLRRKSIPFIFLTTNVEDDAVVKAYEMMVQGYFVKENNIDRIREVIGLIMHYWKVCRHPNSQ
ncbi:MAG: histidine kinase [Flaviaesturariibacter sp.]|nr:histidine kinase [Flaviaesturariibacter sp.]